MMTESRYNTLRSRVLKLFNILNNRQYEVWVTPTTMMDLDQLRGRYERREEGFANDTTFYSDHQVRRMKIPNIIDLLPNCTSANDLGFRNANDAVVEIYESIQEYISLWCELRSNAPEFPTPSNEELRYLETLAYYLFPMYKKIKPFKMTADINRQLAQDEALNRKGLLGMGMLFGYNKQMDDISFISHLDAAEAQDFMSAEQFVPERQILPVMSSNESLGMLELNTQDNTEWLFRG